MNIKKVLSIILSLAIFLTAICSMALSSSADADYNFIIYDNLTNNLNAGSGTASVSTDSMKITANGGQLTKNSNYGGYAVAQWQSNSNNRNLTFE